MKTRISLFFLGACLLAGVAKAQPPRIVVQGAGAPQVFTQFDAAVAAAQPNDHIYLSGGTFTYPGGMIIDKPLHFIGAGIHPDSTMVTEMTTLQNTGASNNPLRIYTAASGSTFTGIRFFSLSASQSNYAIMFGLTDANDDPSDIVFQRCWFHGRWYLGSVAANLMTTTTFDECVFTGEVNGMGRSAVFTRCIIANGQNTVTITNFAGSSSADNCVIMGAIQSLSGLSVRNSYIRTNNANGYAVYSCSSCLFQNTLVTNNVVASGSPGTIVTNCITNVSGNTVCVAELDGFYQTTDDLHMAAGSPGLGFSLDGTDVGIYGTASPYKPGAVPFNPHVRTAVIAGGTNGNGELPVSIKVAAQTN